MNDAAKGGSSTLEESGTPPDMDTVLDGAFAAAGISDEADVNNRARKSLFEDLRRNATTKLGAMSRSLLASGIEKTKVLLRIFADGIRERIEDKTCALEHMRMDMCVDVGFLLPATMDFRVVIAMNEAMLACTSETIASVMRNLAKEIDIVHRGPTDCREKVRAFLDMHPNDYPEYQTVEAEDEAENAVVRVGGTYVHCVRNETGHCAIDRPDRPDRRKRSLKRVSKETVAYASAVRKSETLIPPLSVGAYATAFDWHVDYERAIALAERNGFGPPRRMTDAADVGMQRLILNKAKKILRKRRSLAETRRTVGASAVVASLKAFARTKREKEPETRVAVTLEAPDAGPVDDAYRALSNPISGYAKQCEELLSTHAAFKDELTDLVQISDTGLWRIAKFVAEDATLWSLRDSGDGDAPIDDLGGLVVALDDVWSDDAVPENVVRAQSSSTKKKTATRCDGADDRAATAGGHAAVVLSVEGQNGAEPTYRVQHVLTGIVACGVKASDLEPVPKGDLEFVTFDDEATGSVEDFRLRVTENSGGKIFGVGDRVLVETHDSTERSSVRTSYPHASCDATTIRNTSTCGMVRSPLRTRQV